MMMLLDNDVVGVDDDVVEIDDDIVAFDDTNERIHHVSIKLYF